MLRSRHFLADQPKRLKPAIHRPITKIRGHRSQVAISFLDRVLLGLGQTIITVGALLGTPRQHPHNLAVNA